MEKLLICESKNKILCFLIIKFLVLTCKISFYAVSCFYYLNFNWIAPTIGMGHLKFNLFYSEIICPCMRPNCHLPSGSHYYNYVNWKFLNFHHIAICFCFIKALCSLNTTIYICIYCSEKCINPEEFQSPSPGLIIASKYTFKIFKI